MHSSTLSIASRSALSEAPSTPPNNARIVDSPTHRVYAGALFTSFDHEANYLAKQAELRNLGLSVDDVTPPRPVTAPAEGESANSQEVPHPALSGGNDDRSELEIIERQLRRREEMFNAAQRRSTDESRQYSEMISQLRAESKKQEVLNYDKNVSLAAQVEALQYVVQRRNDADQQSETLRFVDVEEEIASDAREWMFELNGRLSSIPRVGEDRIRFVEQLGGHEAQLYRDDLLSPDLIRKELDEVRSLLNQNTSIRITMSFDRIRSEVTRLLMDVLRATFIVGPNGKEVSTTLRSLIAAFINTDVDECSEKLCTDMHKAIAAAADAAFNESKQDVKHSVEVGYENVERSAVDAINDSLLIQAREVDAEIDVLRSHLAEIKRNAAEKREHDESMMRAVILEMGKLLESQRLATNDLRQHLLLKAKTIAAMTSAAEGSPNLQSKRLKPTMQSPTMSQRSSHGLAKSPAASKRALSPAASRRLLFEPLTREQVKALYHTLPTHATVVEEVSVETLNSIKEKAKKTHRVSDDNQIIVMSKAPSLLGRGSTKKVPTTLTAASGENSKALAAEANLSQRKQLADKFGKRIGGQSVDGFEDSELATLQELRRLRTKIASPPSASRERQ